MEAISSIKAKLEATQYHDLAKAFLEYGLKPGDVKPGKKKEMIAEALKLIEANQTKAPAAEAEEAKPEVTDAPVETKVEETKEEAAPEVTDEKSDAPVIEEAKEEAPVEEKVETVTQEEATELVEEGKATIEKEAIVPAPKEEIAEKAKSDEEAPESDVVEEVKDDEEGPKEVCPYTQEQLERNLANLQANLSLASPVKKKIINKKMASLSEMLKKFYGAEV